MIKTIIPVITIFFLYAGTIKAQVNKPVATNNKLKSTVDSIVHRVAYDYMLDTNAVGLSIGIYRNGKKYTYHYGEIRKGSKILPGNKSIYDIGSVAKVFVTTMLAKAVTDKKVKLDDDIRKYLPGDYPNLSYKGYPVKLVHLANHTSGLPPLSRDYSDATIDSVMRLNAQGLKNFYTVYTADSLLKDMHHFTVDTTPGTQYRYNGNAMQVLLLLLEKIYSEPYEKLATRFLQSRFKMFDTRITLSPADEKALVQGYENGQPQTYVNFNGYRAAPGINSTIYDMLQFIQVNIEEADAAVRLTHQPTFTKLDSSFIGLGWMIEVKDHAHRMIYHSGRGSGITTLCTMHPEQQTGIIIITNDGRGEGRLFEMEERLLKGFVRHGH